MKKITKKQWAIIVGTSVVIVFAAFLVFVNKGTSSNPAKEQTESVLENTESYKKVESKIKVSLDKIQGGKKVVLKIDNIPQKYSTIDYELSYETSKQVPRGVLGTITVEGPSYEKEVVLGSCSTNVCTYDEGVESAKLTLLFNSSGSPRIFEKTFKL